MYGCKNCHQNKIVLVRYLYQIVQNYGKKVENHKIFNYGDTKVLDSSLESPWGVNCKIKNFMVIQQALVDIWPKMWL